MAGATWLGEARVRGRLYALTWYPALKLDEGADWVVGDVFEMEDDILIGLDAFEGDEYERVRVEPEMIDARMEWDDSHSWAWVWQWRGSVEGLQPIPTGDWLGYLQPPGKPWWTTLGCLGLLAFPIGGAMLLGFLNRWFAVSETVSEWSMVAFLIGAGALGLFSLTMSHRARESPNSRLISVLHGLMSVGVAGYFLIGVFSILGAVLSLLFD
ncbi:MAG: gamma-glutamylcyclotransferase [Akkermansiaceae bacterium]|jgi:gamma-glutamylcyclotransferase (GGCT)/AIG2-like uncharacterized protein YtfP|nr:gamma-glutamylcyclotransferase [Akkermansiaceae bacterium]